MTRSSRTKVESTKTKGRKPSQEPIQPLVSKQGLVLDLSLRVYPLETIYSACYLFVERCWILLDQQAPGRVLVRLKPRGKSPIDMETLAADFSAELLRQALRLKIAKRTAAVREMLLGRALLAAEPLTLDPMDTTGQDDYLADPLGIAVPWEERFEQGDADREAIEEPGETKRERTDGEPEA